MEQNTQEWLDFRRNKIGASDCPVILGISPYRTSYQLWEEKVFGKEQIQTSAMARGHELEETARQEFEKLTGISVMPKVMVHPKRSWQMASLDGISFDGSTFVEIKCPNKEIHQMAEDGRIPVYYYAQMQHQMSVINADQGFYFSFDGSKGALVPINRDNGYIQVVLEKEEKFFECMINKEPPALTDKDYIIQNGQEWVKIADEWKELSSYIETLKESQEELRNKLIAFANGQNSKGNGVRVTRSISKGVVDYKKIPELIGVDLELYRKPSSEKWTLAACK